MQASKLDDQQLKAMGQLKDSEIEKLLRQELRNSQGTSALSKEDVITRWHQGRQQLLFEMIELIETARELLHERQQKPQRKHTQNAF